MKKYTKNIIVFVLAALMVVSGAATKGYATLFAGNAYHVAVLRDRSVDDAISRIESEASVRFRYRNALMDMNSLVLRLSDTRTVEKPDTTIVLSDSGYLCEPLTKVSPETVDGAAQSVAQLKEYSEKNGAEFLYVLAPDKSADMSFPSYIENHSEENYGLFADAFRERGVELLDLRAAMAEDGITPEEMFFVTDHHWKPEYGLWTTGRICADLKDRYGLEYDDSLCDISNYDVKNYENWFLGSYGKKTGRFFSPLGIDDIKLITPKFATDLVEEQPVKNEVKKGDFSQTVMVMKNIEKRDLYALNSYAAYSGGDFRLQKITNNNAKNGKKLMIIRDSFACAVLPYLCLNFSETYAVDIRDGDYYVGGKENIPELIGKIKPDYVVVLYRNLNDDLSGRFEFFGSGGE
jgi:hypothetical protein